MKIRLLLCITLISNIFFGFINADEYLYPVASVATDKGLKVYVLYQKSLEHLELWLWDPTTKKADKALLSRFTPAGLKVLPDHSGFSFIDNGRIKIKSFLKRSPKSVDIYEPIYNITLINWLTPTSCYFSAKEVDRYKVFHLEVNGEAQVLAQNENADYMYPQKIGNQLFFIKRIVYRNAGYHYVIGKIPYPVIPPSNLFDFNDTDTFDQKVRYLLEQEQRQEEPTIDEELLLDFGNPIAFLHMISQNEGFVLEHPGQVNSRAKSMRMSYHHLRKVGQGWQSSYLFSFEVPLHLLSPKSNVRLYESMLPLLPRHIGRYLYYNDSSQGHLDVYRYSLANKAVERLTAAKLGQHFFAPCALSDAVYFGGSISEGFSSAPCMFEDADGDVGIALPKIMHYEKT